jgi:type II secretory pathway predicted ATPase ExeA
MFGQKTQPAWFFDSSVHLEAVSRLLYLVESHEALGFVYGPDGSGRTRVFSRLQEEFARAGTSSISLNLSGLDEESALWQLTGRISARARASMKHYELLSLLRDELTGRSRCGIQTVLLLDDYHRAVSDFSVLLRVLLALNAQCQGLLNVVIASDRPLPDEFAQHSLVRVNLPAMDSAESSDFVRTLLRRYAVRPSVVEESAVRAISEIATGNAARISNICDLLRVLHESSPETRINEETVRALLTELLPDSGWRTVRAG